MSSFLLFLRLSTAFEFDETFPRTPVSSSLFRFLSLLSFLVLHFSLSFALFFPIPLHPYCQCNPRYSAELSLLALTFAERRSPAIVDPHDSLKFHKNVLPHTPFFPSNITFPAVLVSALRTDIIPRNISPFCFSLFTLFPLRAFRRFTSKTILSLSRTCSSWLASNSNNVP